MSIITRRDGKTRISYHRLFTMKVAGEEISVRKATDPWPEDLAALDVTAIKLLLLHTRDRKLMELDSVIESKWWEIEAREEADLNPPEDFDEHKKREQEEAAIREEWRRNYEEMAHRTIDERINWPGAAGPLPEHNGLGHAKEIWQEMQQKDERRQRYKAERVALRKVEAQAKAAIITAHRL